MKLHCTLIAWTLGTVVLYPNNARAQGVQVEAFAGVSFANMASTQETVNYFGGTLFNSITRFPFGISADFRLSDYFLFGTGIQYSPRGSTVESFANGIFGGTSRVGIHLNYIDLPALLVLQPSTFRIFVGPQLSFLASADLDGSDIGDVIEGTSFGIRYGIGFDSDALAIRVSGQNGFTDVFKNPNEEWQTNAYTISVGYLLVKMRESARSGKSRKKDPIVPEHRKLDY